METLPVACEMATKRSLPCGLDGVAGPADALLARCLGHVQAEREELDGSGLEIRGPRIDEQFVDVFVAGVPGHA